MKNVIVTCTGLVSLSVLGGYVLFASHTALAAGPKLPMTLMQAHAVTADGSARVVPAALTGFDTDTGATALTPGAPDLSSDNARPVDTHGDVAISRQQRDDALAPFRALRPVSREDQWVVLAQDTFDNDPRDDVTDNPNTSPTRPTANRAPDPEPDDGGFEIPFPRVIPQTTPTFGQATQPVRRPPTSPEPGYWFGVFR